MKKLKVWQLIVLLVVVVFGSVLFVGLAAGWFSDGTKIVIDKEYLCVDECENEFEDISAADYEQLINNKKSFVLFVDQDGCSTANRLRGFASDWASQEGIKLLKMMFSDVKESSLFENVKFYPSVVAVSKGNVVGWLKADSDDDALAYNNYDDFLKWMKQFSIKK